MLDVRRMRVLREVAQRGSFSAAAEALSFTQSAVSQQIAALEREAGTTLVERSVRGIRLTDAGRALVRHTEAILGRLAEAEAELEAIAGLRGGRLRMASFESAGATLMPLAIATFRERHPAVELSLSLAEPMDSVPQLKSGELEIALSFDPNDVAVPSGESIEYVHLLDDPLYLALAPDHPLAHKRNLRLADLASDAWIEGTPNCACSAMLRRACERAGFAPRIAFESDDYAAIQGFVAAGVGVALIAELALTTVRDDIVIRSLGRETPIRRIHAAALAGGYRSPATTAMLEILTDVAANYRTRRPDLQLVAG
jgi:DNA-binding transcriptional LysR family regulator